MSYALAAMTLMGGSAITSGIGSFYSAKSSKSALKAEAAMAGTNARLSELAARQEMLRGETEVANITRRAGQIKSSQRTAMAANGIDLGEGSAAELQASTDLMKEIDKNTAEANAVRAAWGYRTQGMNYQNQATTARAAASGISPGMTATSSLLGSASQVAMSWYSMNKAGAFNSPSNASPVFGVSDLNVRY